MREGKAVRVAGVALLVLASVWGVGGACGSKGGGSSGSGAGSGSPGSAGNNGTSTAAGPACSDLFDQSMVRTYSIDIAPDVMASIDAEFHDTATLLAKGNDFVTRHPVTLHMGSETVSDATFKLHGQSSWLHTVMFDGDRAKMQFDISFHQSDPNGNFHGVGKLVFDMSRDDWTFMHDRLAHAWFRQAGIAAGCAANARVELNGAYYGLYVVEENTNKNVIKQFFPDHPSGDLWKAANQPETGTTSNTDRLTTFKQAKDIASVTAIVDVPTSVREWAGEALINDADGTYGGTHNFYIYDTGAKGFVYLPNDTDSTFEWLVANDVVGATDHPIYWWEGRTKPAPVPGAIWLAVMNDPTARGQYVDAVAAVLAQWDVGQIQGWIDAWSKQIADAVASDPHAWATAAQFQDAVAKARDIVKMRADFLQSFVACQHGNSGDDKDGDGVRWCNDCRDDDASVHPGAKEICGNGVDDDCNGVPDDGC
ncbi:MAG TPA: CotH kinase family protein [Polyangia bacterium]